ncbi:MAG: hypothetical protein ACE5FU_09700, partial [Nitrospinota bacterium]
MSFKNRLVSIFSYFKRGIGNKKAIISLVFLTPVLAIFLLNSFFPSEVLRVRAEEFLSGQLGGTARISHISFVPLMGLKVEDLHIDSAQIGRITVNRLILDYNLLALLKGRLHINSVQLADAKVEISLPPANTTAINEKTAPAEPLQLPSLPIKIKVKEFSIKKTDFKVEIDKTRTIEIQDMNVNIACDLTTRESELGGELTVDLIKIREGTKTLQLPIASRFDIRADLAREKLEVENFVFSAGSIMTIRLNGLLTDILEEREIRANLFLEKLDLKPLGTTLADFIPAEYRDAVVLGVFSGSAKLDGSLKNSFDGSIDLLAEGNTVKAEFSGDEISFTRMTVDLSVPTVNIQTGELKGSFESAVTGLSIASQKNEALLHPFDFQFALRGFNLVHFVPVSASASLQIPKISGRYQSLSSHLDGFEIQTGITDVDPLFHTGYGSFDLAISGVDAKDELLDFTLFPTKVHFSLPRIELHGEVPDVKKVLLEIESPGGNFKAHSVKKISITASGEASRDTSVQLSTKVSGEVFELLLEPGYRVSFPAAASLSLTGNLRNQKLAIDHLNFSSKTVGEATLKGRVEAAIEGRDKFAFLGDLKIMPDIPEMQKHLPPPTQKKLEIKKSGSTPDLVHVTLEGNLGGDYLPEEAHVLGGIELHKLTVNNTSPELGGALEKLDFQFESDYEKASGIIKANGTSKALFSHLRKGQEEFFVKRLGLDISSYVSGNFNLETSAFKNISGGLLFRGEGIDISEKNLPLGLSSVLVSANVKGDAKDLKTIQSASISTEATVKGVQIQGAEAESAHATISVKTGPSGILNSVSVLDFKGKKIVWKEKGARATVDTLSLSLGTRQNLENNEFILSGFRVAADDFFALTGEGSYRM